MVPTMSKLLFLDIDGVLNSFQHTLLNPVAIGMVRLPENELNATNVGLLKYAVEQTRADIVVTSTWRKEFIQDELIAIFNRVGWKDIPIIGYTPVTSKNFRGEEVALFLELYAQDYDLERYVIVDDSSDYYLNDHLQMDFRFNQPLVRTDARIGFSYQDLLGVLHYLDPGHELVPVLKDEVRHTQRIYVDTPWLRV